MKLTVSHWYLDCVAPNGDFFVGTATSIRRSKLHFNLISISYGRGGNVVNKHAMTFAENSPRLTDSSLTWDCGPLDIRGSWVGNAAPTEKTLLSTAKADIHYQGVIPRSEATVGVGGNFRLAGLGYGHRILVTSHGWSIPINEIRVGRYLSQKESLNWLDLTGANAGTWVWRNGKEHDLASVTDDLVALDDNITLGLAYKRPIREGQLGDTILASLPVLKYLVPSQMSACSEHLWRTKAVLLNGLEETDSGWAIHSVIRSPR